MYKLLIARIKELQGEKSVSAFARYLEMPQKTVDTYINGERKPSVEFVMRVCSKCHVTSDWLLGLSDVRTPFDLVERETKQKENTQKNDKLPMSLCRSVRQSDNQDKPQEISKILCNITHRITQLEARLAALSSVNSMATCG